MANGAAGRIASLLEGVLGTQLPIGLTAWDGSRAGPADGPSIVIKHKRALRRLLWHPDEIGLARGWVAGEIDFDGDLEEGLTRLEANLQHLAARPRLTRRERLRAFRAAARMGIVGREPAPPAEEVALVGRRHSKKRDEQAVRHHYDVGNEFYELVLGPSMVYSCAYWMNSDGSLEDAQLEKLALICRKLELEPGQRLLDVGCGWGGLVIHAAKEHGVEAVGVTLSPEQADYARARAKEMDVDKLVDIRVQDWRDVDDGPYDAIASVGMAEHLGASMWPDYAARLYGLVKPGGRLLNHQIVRVPRRASPKRSDDNRSFIDAYVFPDGELIPVGHVVGRLEGGGFEVRDVHGLREHYARTLRAWVSNLRDAWDRAVALAGEGRARVWLLYMTGSALSFDAARIAVHQVLAVRPHDDGRSDMPAVRQV